MEISIYISYWLCFSKKKKKELWPSLNNLSVHSLVPSDWPKGRQEIKSELTGIRNPAMKWIYKKVTGRFSLFTGLKYRNKIQLGCLCCFLHHMKKAYVERERVQSSAMTYRCRLCVWDITSIHLGSQCPGFLSSSFGTVSYPGIQL